eukprot:6893445-Prymnesium_polylepis.1
MRKPLFVRVQRACARACDWCRPLACSAKMDSKLDQVLLLESLDESLVLWVLQDLTYDRSPFELSPAVGC